MFSKETYKQRRTKLREQVQEGVILIMGNVDVPMNYADNTYRFRQDSNFLYFFGLDQQGLAGVIDVESGEEMLFGDDVTVDDIIWMGPQPSMKERASEVGVEKAFPFSTLKETLSKAQQEGRKVHFSPPYRAENKLMLEEFLGIPAGELTENSSEALIKAVVALRSVKEDQEVAEIEKAIETAHLMHTTAMKMAKPGVYEHQIAGMVEGIALSGDGMLSFPLILSVHGETLHNHSHKNKLENGQLMLMDAGAESPRHYATDHTRTSPVSGQYSEQQKAVYNIVLNAQIKAIQAIKPGVTFKRVHMLAAETIVSGLKELGFIRGDVASAVEQGAHALFMPHGLGHMMGLDAHDMEDLGENYVGYDDEIKRSDDLGKSSLRFGRKLQEGFVVTVEPGIYFIPELVEKWEQEKKLTDFIDYEKVKSYLGFGGIRIEDDILVTADGYRVLGKPIPKTVEEVEKAMAAGSR